VYLIDADGDRLPAVNLSGGAFDQLYLAIRITIATRLLADEKGFLILDDPFVKADDERLGRMMEMLRRLVAEGWQILYFSAKDEVRQTLAKDIDAGSVRLVTLEAPSEVTALPGQEDDVFPSRQTDQVANVDRTREAEESGDIGLAGREGVGLFD
jgi:ABC-type molybdate transport system ATPase subunit